VRRFHLAGNLVIALLRRFAYYLALPHELVPVDFAAFVDAHNSPRFRFPCFLAASLGPAAELAPLLHPANKFLVAPFFLAGLGTLAAHETCGLVYVAHGVLYYT